MWVPISISLKLRLYVVPNPRYSASKNGVTLKLGQGSFKVIENGAVPHIINDFLLVGHCKYGCMLYHFQVIWRCIIMTLKRSLKVIQTGNIRKFECGFLFAFHSNYSRIFNRSWDIQHQRITRPWKLSQISFKIIENGAVRYTIDNGGPIESLLGPPL